MKPLIVYIDMDDTIADFIGSPKLNQVGITPEDMPFPKEMLEPGFFRSLKPIDGAIEAIHRLLDAPGLELHILTKPVHYSPQSYSEKVLWIHHYLPVLSHRVVMTQNKELCHGDFLVDDSIAWKALWEAACGGKFIHFDPRQDRAAQWKKITETLLLAGLSVKGCAK